MEKNIPAEAKRALLHNDVGQFQAKCGDVEPETAMVFQVALQELEKPAPATAARAEARPEAASAAGRCCGTCRGVDDTRAATG